MCVCVSVSGGSTIQILPPRFHQRQASREQIIMATTKAKTSRQSRQERRKKQVRQLENQALRVGSNTSAVAAAERRMAGQQTVNAAPKPRAQAKSARPKKAAAGSGLHPSVSGYLAQLNDPHMIGHGKVPLNPMGVPTNNSFTYKQYNTVPLSAAATTATEVGFWPGHNYADASDPLDLVSAHAYTQNINGTTFLVGPCSDGIRQAAIGFYHTGNSVDQFTTQTSVINTIALQPAELAPFSAADASGEHTRWRLQSFNVVIENVTPMASIAGDIVVVQPDHKAIDVDAGSYIKYTSFERHPGTKPVVVNWLPRTEDLYWWHSDTGTVATYNLGLGIKILLNNTSATTQNYRLTWIANWEISGARYAALATPTHDSAQGTIVVPRAINAARNHSGTTKHITAHAAVEAAGADSGLAKSLPSRLAGMYKTLPQAVTDHAERVFGAGWKALGAAAGAAAAFLG